MKLTPRPISAAQGRTAGEAAFTMVEIAISLAIIGFALVAIIGVLPFGMNVQRENREETIINQDAAYFAEAIRGGARGLDDLTNAVFAITNYWTYYVTNAAGTQVNRGPDYDGYTYPNSRVTSFSQPPDSLPLTNGLQIVGLLGTPKYIFSDVRGQSGFYSNYVLAYVHALSGLAAEKFPQTNADVRLDAFSYRLITENIQLPVPQEYGTNDIGRQLTYNLRELRLSFRWPLLPSGKLGNGRQTYRTLVGGPLTNGPAGFPGNMTWFFESQTFVKAP